MLKLEKSTLGAFTLTIFLMVAIIGCANTGEGLNAKSRNSQSELSADGTKYTSYLEMQPDTFPAGTSCPTDANIIPDDDIDGETEFFYACRTTQSKNFVFVRPVETTATSICAFPATYGKIEATSDQFGYSVYPNPDITTITVPYSLCAPPSAKGLYFDFSKATSRFPLTSMSAVYIVKFEQRSQMESCLRSGNYYLCPPYSFGDL